jgi:hypothetical protein
VVVAGPRKGSRQPEADRVVRADDGRAGLLPGADRLVPRLENGVATGFNQLHPDTGDIGVKWRDFIALDPRVKRLPVGGQHATRPLGQSGLRARRHRPRHCCAAGTLPNGADPLMRLFVTL